MFASKINLILLILLASIYLFIWFHIKRKASDPFLNHFKWPNVHKIWITSIFVESSEPLAQASSADKMTADVKLVILVKLLLNEKPDWGCVSRAIRWSSVWFNIATSATLKFTFSPYTMAIPIDPKIDKMYRAGTKAVK